MKRARPAGRAHRAGPVLPAAGCHAPRGRSALACSEPAGLPEALSCPPQPMSPRPCLHGRRPALFHVAGFPCRAQPAALRGLACPAGPSRARLPGTPIGAGSAAQPLSGSSAAGTGCCKWRFPARSAPRKARPPAGRGLNAGAALPAALPVSSSGRCSGRRGHGTGCRRHLPRRARNSRSARYKAAVRPRRRPCGHSSPACRPGSGAAAGSGG